MKGTSKVLEYFVGQNTGFAEQADGRDSGEGAWLCV
jgi:hypothetical protein